MSGKQSARRQVPGCKGDPPGTPTVSSKCRQTGELLWAECGLGLVGGGSPLLSPDSTLLAKGTAAASGEVQNRSQKSLFLFYLLVGSGTTLGTPGRRVYWKLEELFKGRP